MDILSPDFSHEGPIPIEYTCEAADTSPPLTFQNIPAGTKSLALIVDDPDAPDPKAPKMLWIHWVLYNLTPDTTELPKNVSLENLPNARAGTNSWEKTTYGGPCPPIGEHRYFHTLYALDTVLPDLDFPTAETLRKAMEGHIIEKAVLMGTYEKQK